MGDHDKDGNPEYTQLDAEANTKSAKEDLKDKQYRKEFKERHAKAQNELSELGIEEEFFDNYWESKEELY
jgi:hypothetical protein